MGQIVRRKRKGRPSNSDRAHRKSSGAPPSPVDRRRSRRRRNVRYHFDIDDYVDDDEFYDDEDEEVGRREKKLRLLLCEDDSRSNRRVTHAPSSSSSSSSSSSEDDDEDDDVKPSKKRKIVGGDEDDDEDNEIEEIRVRKLEEEEDDDEEEEEEELAAGRSDFGCGTTSDLPGGVPLPDKRTLELILDKLQKKDIYGVYAEPVDPEELPDYHDVIKQPMDFATVKKKLAKGLYLNLKEFESDVLLICTNAMQYNAPDTIYYKQASSIQELAKLKFQRLRANVDRSEIEPKSEPRTTPSFSLPKKQLKKSVVWTSQDPVGSDSISGGNVRTGEFPNGSSAQTPVRPNNSDVQIAVNSPDNNLDKEQELVPGKGFTSKFGRKSSVHDENRRATFNTCVQPVHDENRRATYNTSVQPVTESNSIFSTFEGESKHFIPVGLHADHSYARSLSRFAATLGSVAWKVASQTIEQALPEGVKYGRGWVGEYEPLSTPVLMPGNCTLKEPNFLAHFQINSNDGDEKRTFEVTAPGNDRTRKGSVDGKKLNDNGHDSQKPPGFGNTTVGYSSRIPVKQDSPRESSKDPRPPFFSSLQVKPSFAGSNILQQNSPSRNFKKPEMEGLPQVELNHPPPTHVRATDFVATRPVSNASEIPSPRSAKPVSRTGNLASLASFKHPNGNNNGYVSGRPSNREPAPVGLDCNRMVPANANRPYQQEAKPIATSRDGNRMVPTDNILPHRQEKQQGLSDPVQMMKMLSEKAQHQHNSNGFGFGSGSPFSPKREDANNAASTIPHFSSKPQQHQQISNGSQTGSKKDDSTNAALTAAQAWMTLGGGGGFMKPPLSENTNPHKQQIYADSLYNPTRDRQQPQVSRFHGEFPVPGIQFQPDKNSYQQPVHSFVPQPVGTINEVHLQNRHVGFPQIATTDLSRFQVQPSWRGAAPQMLQQQQQLRPKQQESRAPDLNIGYQSMGSPVRQSTGMLVDSQQPDLALQL